MRNPDGYGAPPGPAVSATVDQPAPGTARRPAGEVERHPLSAVQHAMLLHSISAPGEGVYLLQKILTLHERLNTAMFEQALRQLFEWHPMLRTSLLLDHPEGGRVTGRRCHWIRMTQQLPDDQPVICRGCRS
ncbi:condensation domain-containing protein [Frankia sp. Cas3]|uniref:condensation domain-containing protein n=1 Tax=Frankia sp. Cas3 TaxID=3073926 RepID=UPI003A101994